MISYYYFLYPFNQCFLSFQYEYEPELEESYRSSLIKSFKKQIDDGYFSFIMVDCINNLTKHYEEIWSYAKQKGFEVFIKSIFVFSLFYVIGIFYVRIS